MPCASHIDGAHMETLGHSLTHDLLGTVSFFPSSSCKFFCREHSGFAWVSIEIYNPRSSHSSWIGDGTTLAALQLLSQARSSGLRSTPRPFTSVCYRASGTGIFTNWPAHMHYSKPIHVIFIPSSPGLLFVLYGLTLAAGSLTPLGTLFHLCTLLKKNMGGHTLSSTRERTARSVPQTI